jgi:hypothetical protein
MSLERSLAAFILASALVVTAAFARAQTPLDSPVMQSAAEELAEAQMRRDFQESRRIFARMGSGEEHAMVEREGLHARSSVRILLAVCLMLLVLFAFPLFEDDKVTINDPSAAKRD